MRFDVTGAVDVTAEPLRFAVEAPDEAAARRLVEGTGVKVSHAELSPHPMPVPRVPRLFISDVVELNEEGYFRRYWWDNSGSAADGDGHGDGEGAIAEVLTTYVVLIGASLLLPFLLIRTNTSQPYYGTIHVDVSQAVVETVALTSVLVLLAALLPCAFSRREPVKHQLMLRRPFGSPLAWMIAVFGAVALSLAVGTAIAVADDKRSSVYFQFTEFAQTLSRGQKFQLAVVIAVLAPLAEELMFRGFALRRLSWHLPPAAAVTIASFLFAVLHMDVAHGMYAFVLGLWLGGVALAFQSVTVPVAAHLVINALATLQLLNSGSGGGDSNGSDPDVRITPLGAGVAAVCAGLCILLNRRWRQAHPQAHEVPTAATPPKET